jgi:hypothetical protein
MRCYLVAAIAMSFVSVTALADPNIGTVRICRDPIINGIDDASPVLVPAGSRFVQMVVERATDAVKIELLEDVSLGPRPSCALGPAVVVHTSNAAPSLRDYPYFLKQFSIPRADLRVTAAKGFR